MSNTLDTKPLLELDPWLEPYLPSISHRWSLYKKWKDTIDNYEGGYGTFTQGYKKMGLTISPSGEITYREWAPNAKEAVLIGEFSKFFTLPHTEDIGLLSRAVFESPNADNWNRISHPLVKDQYGIWSITLPPKAPGVPALAHDSKIKVCQMRSYSDQD
jgi:1,4-alpha-glucan branching enzyme